MLKKTKVLTFQKSYLPTSQLYYKDVPLIETKEYNFLGNVIDYKTLKEPFKNWQRKD